VCQIAGLPSIRANQKLKKKFFNFFSGKKLTTEIEETKREEGKPTG